MIPHHRPDTDGSGEYSALIPDRASLETAYQQAIPLYQYALLVIEQRLRETLERGAIRPSIKGRVKSFESLFAKRIRVDKNARMSGRQALPITDVIAVRVICPFLGDLQEAEYLIGNSFHIVEIERKGSERSFREFGYESIHMLAELPEDLRDAATGLDQPVFEIQLRTILQEAWAEVEHELVYKAEFTPFDEPLKRKLAALNATLSLSDIIFQEILDYQRRLNTELERRRENFHGKIEASMDTLLHLSSTARASTFREPAPHPVPGAAGPAKLGEDSLASLVPFMPSASQVSEPEAAHLSGSRAEALPSDEGRFRTLDELLLSALEAHNRGDFEAAVDLYSAILARNPAKEIASVVFKHRGMAHFSRSSYAPALQDFSKSLELDPLCYKAAYYRGVARSVMQDFLAAIQDFNLALDIHPFHFWSRYRRAMAFFQLGDFAQALSDCEAALRIKPESGLVLGLRDLARSKLQL